MNVSFNESYMLPGFGSKNRTPETSRVQRTPAKAPRIQAPSRKALSRSCVSVVKSDNGRMYEVFVKGSGALLGTIRSANGSKGKAYSYKLITEARSHSGFGSQKAALDRMLEKV